jgi:ribosomal protein S18 acetylase RimI-like enzyme
MMHGMEMKVRAARPTDLDTIASFNVAMALEAEHKHLDPSTVRSGVAAALGDDAKGRYFIAEQDGVILGQLMITYEWSDWRNGTFWWIQSVYVRPEARRRGVFRALFSQLEERARDEPGVCGIRLYVEDENARAQRTYASCGMSDAAYRVMEIDYSNAVRQAGD